MKYMNNEDGFETRFALTTALNYKLPIAPNSAQSAHLGCFFKDERCLHYKPLFPPRISPGTGMDSSNDFQHLLGA